MEQDKSFKNRRERMNLAIQNIRLIQNAFQTCGDQFIEYLKLQREEKFIPQIGFDSKLDYIKNNYNPDDVEIELIGLCTDICVVSNALLWVTAVLCVISGVIYVKQSIKIIDFSK